MHPTDVCLESEQLSCIRRGPIFTGSFSCEEGSVWQVSGMQGRIFSAAPSVWEGSAKREEG